MLNWGPFLTVLFVLFGLLLLAGGLLLLKRGLWPRRKGTDPHCRHCEYNLTGLQEGICPECGQPWTLAAAGRGHRQRRPRWVIGGSLLLLAACLWFVIPTSARLANFSYFSLLPTRVVLSLADSSGKGTGQKAVDEMAARLATGTVSAEQAERFFRKIAKFDLTVRQKVIENERVPYKIVLAIPPVAGAAVEHGPAGARVDGQPTRDRFSTSFTETDLRSGSSGGGISSRLLSAPVGRHVLELDYHVRYKWPVTPGLPASTGKCEFTIPLRTELEVLPADSPDSIKVVRDPTLTQELQKRVQLGRYEVRIRQSGRYVYVDDLAFRLNCCPVELAFDVIFRVQGKEYPVSWFTACRNRDYSYTTAGEYEGPATQAVDIILRSNSKIARETVDLTEVWEGELVYPDVPLRIQGSTMPVAAAQPMAVPASRPTPTTTGNEQE